MQKTRDSWITDRGRSAHGKQNPRFLGAPVLLAPCPMGGGRGNTDGPKWTATLRASCRLVGEKTGQEARSL